MTDEDGLAAELQALVDEDARLAEFRRLVERSSLGGPEARALAAEVPPDRQARADQWAAGQRGSEHQ